MNSFARYIEYILSIPKSFYVSWRLTSFKQALKLPVVCRYNVITRSLKGRLIYGGGKIYLGFDYTGIYDSLFQRTVLKIDGDISINNTVRIGPASKICVMSGGKLLFDGKVTNSANVTIICAKEITVSDGTVISWGVTIMDTDFHHIKDLKTEEMNRMTRQITVGKNNWLCANSMVLKGSVLPDNCIVGANSVVTSRFDTQAVIVSGIPAGIVRNNVLFVN